MDQIKAITILESNAKIEAHEITTKQTPNSCKIPKKKNIKPHLTLNSKSYNKKKIKLPSTNAPPYYLRDLDNNILTNPQEIAHKIRNAQQSSFQKQTPTCDDPIDCPPICHCIIRKYS
jgi:hypothetical protein